METNRVFFDVKSGKLAAEGVDDCLIFENQAKIISKDGVLTLYSPDGTKVVSGLVDGYVYKTGFSCLSFVKEGMYVRRVYTPDGKCLVDDADKVVFYSGCWFTVKKRGVLFLYAPNGDLVKSNINSVEVTDDGCFAIVSDEEGYLMLYNQKGILYANGFISFKGNGELFILFYADKILAVDPESFAETLLLEQDVKILGHKKFMGISSYYGKTLYDSTGKVILSKYMDYEVYANGMYRGINYPEYPSCGIKKNALYNADGHQEMSGVVDVIEHKNGCLEVLVEDGCCLFDSKGQYLSFLDEDKALGTCLEDKCFTLMENDKEVLYLPEKIKVAEDFDKVSVYDECGLILVEKENAFFGQSLYSLYDMNGGLLCSAEEFISVDEKFGYYLIANKGGTSFSIFKDGKEVLSGLSAASSEGRLLRVERDNKILVYDLNFGLDKPIWAKASSDDIMDIVSFFNIDCWGKGKNA
ncbi:MAG: hypothetical protein J6J35_01550 [Alphaproteobacteria bacterium]|nr:hypothetical protein [Alphaproteobacteria bacterium]